MELFFFGSSKEIGLQNIACFRDIIGVALMFLSRNRFFFRSIISVLNWSIKWLMCMKTQINNVPVEVKGFYLRSILFPLLYIVGKRRDDSQRVRMRSLFPSSPTPP